jgi:hypothetical protein
MRNESEAMVQKDISRDISLGFMAGWIEIPRLKHRWLIWGITDIVLKVQLFRRNTNIKSYIICNGLITRSE